MREVGDSSMRGVLRKPSTDKRILGPALYPSGIMLTKHTVPVSAPDLPQFTVAAGVAVLGTQSAAFDALADGACDGLDYTGTLEWGYTTSYQYTVQFTEAAPDQTYEFPSNMLEAGTTYYWKLTIIPPAGYSANVYTGSFATESGEGH